MKKDSIKSEDYQKYYRQLIIKKIGVNGQKKIFKSRVLVIGAGGLGCPLILYLSYSGIGNLGIVDHDRIELSNLSRQVLFTKKDVGKFKVSVSRKAIKKINKNIKVKIFRKKIDKKNIGKIAKDYQIICDGTDNFESRFLINDYCIKNKKILILAAINKFDGHIFTFNFKNKKNSPCLKCFIPNTQIEDTSCEREGVVGSLAGIAGSIQANEAVKEILMIGESLCGYILIIDTLKLKFKKIKLNKLKNCICDKKI